MRWEPPEARQGRTAVFLLVAAIFVATALAIALVVGVASSSSGSSGDRFVPGSPVTAVPGGDGDLVIARHGTTSIPPVEQHG